MQAAESLSLPELRDECARVRAAADPDPEATNRRLQQKRCLRRYNDADGFWNLHAKGTPQAGAAFNAVLDTLIDKVFHQARRDGRGEPYEAYAFDALLTMANHAATNTGRNAGGSDNSAADTSTGPGGQPDGGGSSTGAGTGSDQHADTDGIPDGELPDGQPAADGTGDGSAWVNDPGSAEPACGNPGVGAPGTLWELAPESLHGHGSAAAGAAHDARGRAGHPPNPALWLGDGIAPIGPRGIPERYLALLRVDVEALRRGQLAGDETCEIRGVGPIPVPVAKGLLGEAILKLVITRGVDVVNITHLGRGPTTAQKIALAWRTPTCTVAGCWRTRVEHDHRQPWAQTKHTRLDELDPLCQFHHDLKTRHGWALTAGSGKRPLVPPNDPRHPHTAQRGKEARAP